MLELVQEGDELLYRVAFACTKAKHYLIRHDKIFDQEIEGMDLRQIKKQCKDNNLVQDKDYIIHSTHTVVPLRRANAIFLRYLYRLYKLRHPETNEKVSKVTIYFGDSKGNFRNNLAKSEGPNGFGYKAGRAEKPLYYNYVKNVMLAHKDVVAITGMEADDALGLAASTGHILSHIDKDINMIPGTHYNWVDGEFYHVSVDDFGSLEIIDDKLYGRGLKFFYAQLLTGDRTDNIPGVKGYGKAKVLSVLNEINNENEAINIIKQVYVENFGSDAILRLREVADLVWILQREDETGSQYLTRKGLHE